MIKRVEETGYTEMQFVSEQNRYTMTPVIYRSYRAFHGFTLTNRDDYFRVNFDHFYSEHRF